DASTDDGVEVVRGFDDPRIKLLHRQTPGPGGYAARNLAIEEATSEWIAFLDADDAWDAGHLAAMAQAAGEASPGAPVRCVFSGFTNHGAGDGGVDPYTVRYGREETRTFDFSSLIDVWIDI